MAGNRRFLVFAPHADDAELGVGGLLHGRPHSQIEATRVVVMATGGYGRYDGRHVSAQDRAVEAKAGMALLGVTDVVFARAFEENRATEEPYVEIVKAIEKQIAVFKPTDLFVALPSYNQDHRRLFDAFMTALRPGACDWVTRVYAYEYPGNAWGPRSPGWGRTYVPLDANAFEAKIAAVKAHQSQWEGRENTHVGPAGATQLALMRGSECGEKYAELLYLMRGRFA